ncbi:MAG: protein phosphatase 2C domain-containing protein [Dermatophilaceae bacterium]
MTFALDYAARTDVGLVRSRNEDSGFAGPHLLAVSDGMGGHAGGNVASSLVISRLAPLDGDSHGSDDALDILAATIAEANASLAAEMAVDHRLQGMGTTLTALMKAGANALALVHIGDSRAYLLRGDSFTQITKDHSYVQSLVDSGRISQEEAGHHPQRSLVTRVLTGAPEDEPDLAMREARRGDRYLICSDGLSDYVASDTIGEVMGMGLDPRETTKRLVDLAVRGGAPDNVTCVVGDIVSVTTEGDTRPITVGAAAEHQPRGDTDSLPRSPAAKAAALMREVTGAPFAADDGGGDGDGDGDQSFDGTRGRATRRWVRAALVALVLVLSFGAASYGAWQWSQKELYVGQADGKVAIYRGVPQTLGPFKLSSVKEVSDIEVGDLPQMWRDRLDGQVRISDETQAREKLDEIRRDVQQKQTRTASSTTDGSALT